MADLNALIAQGVQFKAPPDPFAQYAQMQQLEQGRQANQLNRLKMEELQRGFTEQNQLRQLDPTAADYLTQVTRVNPKLGFEFGKMQREAETAKLGQQKTQMELAKAKREFVQQAQRDVSRNPSDANITAYKEDLMMDPLFTEQEKMQLAAAADRILALPITERQAYLASAGATSGELQPKFQNFSIPGRGVQTGMVQNGQFTPGTLYESSDVLSPEAQAQKLAASRAGAARVAVTNVGETEYAKKVGGGAGEEDVATYKAMQQLPSDMAKVRETLNILRKSDINTGIGAELFTVLDKARAQVLSDTKAGKRATGTEYLDSLLGSAVFPQIQALGIGARGMDTPAEREFLRKVMTGSISLNKDTLIKMTELRAKGLEELGTRFNSRIASGEMDNFFKASGRKPAAVNLGESVAAPPAEAQIPAASPPIFAVNPTTKQRIMSTDGGNTWAPAR